MESLFQRLFYSTTGSSRHLFNLFFEPLLLPSFLSFCPVVSCEFSCFFAGWGHCLVTITLTFVSQNSKHEQRPPGQLRCSNKTQTLHFTLKPNLEKCQGGSRVHFPGQTILCLFPEHLMVLGEFWGCHFLHPAPTTTAEPLHLTILRPTPLWAAVPELPKFTPAPFLCCCWCCLTTATRKPKAAFGPVLVFFHVRGSVLLGWR